MTKVPGHENDANSTFDSPSLLEMKRAHHWFIDGCETQVFPNKKQAIQASNSKMTGVVSNMNVFPWEQHTPSYQSVSHQLIGHLFGPESVRSTDFDRAKTSSVISDNVDLRRKGIEVEDHYGEDASVGLSISHGMEDPETSPSYGRIRKVKVNPVKDNIHDLQPCLRSNTNREDGGQLTIDSYYKEIETGLVSVGSAYIKEDDSFNLMNQTSNNGDHHIRFLGHSGKIDDNVVSIGDDYGKRDANIISFDGFPDDQDIISLGRTLGSHDSTFYEPSFQASEAEGVAELESSSFDVPASNSQLAKQKPDITLKSRPEYKMRKEAPNSFPSNVRSLISTGMLDGVPVKYVSVTREVTYYLLCFIYTVSCILCVVTPYTFH